MALSWNTYFKAHGMPSLISENDNQNENYNRNEKKRKELDNPSHTKKRKKPTKKQQKVLIC